VPSAVEPSQKWPYGRRRMPGVSDVARSLGMSRVSEHSAQVSRHRASAVATSDPVVVRRRLGPAHPPLSRHPVPEHGSDVGTVVSLWTLTRA
jgi:hypothetical protein